MQNIFVSDVNSLDRLARRNQYMVVAGTQHVFSECKRRGISVVSAYSIAPADWSLGVLKNASSAVSHLEGYVSRTDLSPQKFGSLLFGTVVSVNRSSVVRLLTENFRNELDLFDDPKSVSQPVSLFANSAPAWDLLFLPRKPVDYRFDCRTSTGQKIKINDTAKVNLQLRPSSKPALLRCLGNIKNIWKNRDGNVIRIRYPYSVKSQYSIGSLPIIDEISEIIEMEIHEYIKNTLSVQNAALKNLGAIIRNIGPPSCAFFNGVGSSHQSGWVEALAKANVPIEIMSNGVVAVHGSVLRKRVAVALADNGYNDFPGATKAEPRSPLQVSTSRPDIPSRRVKRVQAVGRQSKREQERFRILFAPNFLSWAHCHHGITASCFEAYRCIESVLTGPARLPEWHFKVRIKTVSGDKSDRSMVRRDTFGIMPEDVVHLLDPLSGIECASYGSHQEALCWADLVITEGATAVMLEALELRKPVLLLREHKWAEPSLPAWSMADVQQRTGRSAVYFASLEDDLHQFLQAIERRHCDLPLLDEELARYVWV